MSAIKEIITYNERNEILKDYVRIGVHSSELSAKAFNIWTIELYENKYTGEKISIITTDTDETWYVMEFENVED